MYIIIQTSLTSWRITINTCGGPNPAGSAPRVGTVSCYAFHSSHARLVKWHTSSTKATSVNSTTPYGPTIFKSPQWLMALAALSEDMSLIPSTQSSSQQPVTLATGDLEPSSGSLWAPSYMWQMHYHTHTHTHTHTHLQINTYETNHL